LYNSGKPFLRFSAGANHALQKLDALEDEKRRTIQFELLDCPAFAQLLCDVHAEEDDWEEMKDCSASSPKVQSATASRRRRIDCDFTGGITASCKKPLNIYYENRNTFCKNER